MSSHDTGALAGQAPEEDEVAVDDDVVAELRRLRRENEVLRQERDILKKATAFFARKGSRLAEG